jgi:hypothetical protein
MTRQNGFKQELIRKAKAEKERIMRLKWQEVENRRSANVQHVKDKITQAMINGETNYVYSYNREESFTDTDLTKNDVFHYFGDFDLEWVEGYHKVIISWRKDEVEN